MPKTKELQEFDRGQIVGAHKFGHSVREIAAQLNIPKSTVQDVISAYQRGQCTPGKSPGRPRKTTPRSDRIIVRAARRSPENRRLTLSSLTSQLNQTLPTTCSKWTVSRRLK